MALIVNVPTGQVEGQFVVGVVDGDGENSKPRYLPARGSVVFTATAPYVPNPVASPNPVTMLKKPVVALLDNEGYLCTPTLMNPEIPGRRGIRLAATDNASDSVKGWTWEATPRFVDEDGATIPGTIPTFTFALPGNTVVDLTTVVKVPASTGIGEVQTGALAAAAMTSAREAATDAAAAKASAASATNVANAARAEIPALVASGIASSSAVTDAAAAAVQAETTRAGIVTGQVSLATAIHDEYRGGFIGVNGRPTDLVFDKDGHVPEPVISDWAERLRPKVGGVQQTVGHSSRAAGGFAGDNGRETDLIVDENGKIVEHVIKDWAERLRPLLDFADDVPEAPRLDPYLGLHRNIRVRDAQGTLRYQTSRSDSFAAWGDSLTDGYPIPPFAADHSDAWPGVLSRLLGKPVYNGGIQGQTADEIALRAGGLVPYLLPEGGKIPASGTVNISAPGQLIGWRTDRYFGDTGTLAGVPGSIVRVGSSTGGTFTFRRTTAGAEVAMPTAQPWISAGSQYSDATAILMLGRNDIGYASTGTDVVSRIVAANVAIIDSLTPKHPRFLILGTTNSTGEYRDSAGWKLVTEANRILFEMYPDNFLDIRSFLVNESIYDQKLTPTADDLTRMSRDAPPQQIMHDGTHYNVATAASIGNRIFKELKLKGWAA